MATMSPNMHRGYHFATCWPNWTVLLAVQVRIVLWHEVLNNEVQNYPVVVGMPFRIFWLLLIISALRLKTYCEILIIGVGAARLLAAYKIEKSCSLRTDGG
jgi:hypothetical protein